MRSACRIWFIDEKPSAWKMCTYKISWKSYCIRKRQAMLRIAITKYKHFKRYSKLQIVALFRTFIRAENVWMAVSLCKKYRCYRWYGIIIFILTLNIYKISCNFFLYLNVCKNILDNSGLWKDLLEMYSESVFLYYLIPEIRYHSTSDFGISHTPIFGL